MTTVIERYAKTRGARLFRADDEVGILHDSARGHFPVYLQTGNGISLRAQWSAGLGRAELSNLHECVKRFNDHNPWLTATVRDNPVELGVVGTIWFGAAEDTDFGVFARFLDMFLSSAARLFEQVYSEMTARYLQTTG